ncbi:response regulator [Paramagnetospirillum magnetotacticum]|jgi:DNA-binding NtrC family response regulator|uniref:response regulator n=1 Tax=Paramagnetospirillum magnetotacticum TaxID=188 RepID=UPI00059788AE|nr:response regulator [Paramagnetospirillum magnetotacticum]
MQKPSLLFVDDEPNILSAIHRILNPHRDKWDINFASGGDDALDFMANNIVNVIVTDMAMPEMDGKKLIYRLHELFPDTIPIVLSGHWDIATSLRELGPNVRFLSKPINHDLLVWALKDAVTDARLSPSMLLEIPQSPPSVQDPLSKNLDAPYSSSWISVAPNAD